MPAIVQQTYEQVPLDSITPHPRNEAHKGDTAGITESIEDNDFFGAIMVQASTRHIIAGERRFHAARKAGLAEIPALIVDVDDDRALKILLADNRYAERGTWEPGPLAQLLQDLAAGDTGLTGTGFDLDDLDDLLAELDQMEVLPPADTEADYNEDPDETAARAQAGGSTKAAAGLREVILVLPAERADEYTGLLGRFRKVYGDDHTQGELALYGARLAAHLLDRAAPHEPGDGCDDCAAVEAAGAGHG
jgi:ParB-like chromosome segregation protein Spo0J